AAVSVQAFGIHMSDAFQEVAFTERRRSSASGRHERLRLSSGLDDERCRTAFALAKACTALPRPIRTESRRFRLGFCANRFRSLKPASDVIANVDDRCGARTQGKQMVESCNAKDF